MISASLRRIGSRSLSHSQNSLRAGSEHCIEATQQHTNAIAQDCHRGRRRKHSQSLGYGYRYATAPTYFLHEFLQQRGQAPISVQVDVIALLILVLNLDRAMVAEGYSVNNNTRKKKTRIQASYQRSPHCRSPPLPKMHEINPSLHKPIIEHPEQTLHGNIPGDG